MSSKTLYIQINFYDNSVYRVYTRTTMRYTLFEGDTTLVEYESVNNESHSVMKKLLAKRGLFKGAQINSFLEPQFEELVKDPFDIVDLKKGAQRIVDAMKDGEVICVYSDYDCDGLPGGAIMSDFFDTIGYTKRIHYTPHRHKEGYGLNNTAIEKLASEGVTLIVTVDNGITAINEVLHAKEKGIDVIITDHHLLLRNDEGEQVLPEAYAIINSKRDDCTYHDDMLCGSGVAWKLVSGVMVLLREEGEGVVGGKISSRAVKNNPQISAEYTKLLERVAAIKEGYEKWWLDLVAIATIADMVPLVRENRALAYYGLQVLRKSPRAGLQKLLSLAKTKQKTLSAQDVAFTIAPRVNAASRMDDPRLAFEMLRMWDPHTAIASAARLEELNTLRKETVKGIKREVMGYDFDANTNVIVVGSESWSPGVLGLIAQEVLEETGKATFVWGKGEGGDTYKGSCRAPECVNLVELMKACEDGTFIGIGGHAQSGGFSVLSDQVGGLDERLNDAFKKLGLSYNTKSGEAVLVDAELTFDQVTQSFYKELEKFEPTGEGNERPLFLFRSDGATCREFGKSGGHYEIIYKNSKGGQVKAIYFFGESEKLDLVRGGHILIASFEESHFGTRPELRLRVVDLLKSDINHAN